MKNRRNIIFCIVLCVAIICVFSISRSLSNAKKINYYAKTNNYVNVIGTLNHIKYNEEKTALYLGFSNLSHTFDDSSFKIVGKSLEILKENGIDEKLVIGKKIEFISAPRYFGDGYVMPIVSISIDGECLLEFDEGYTNLLEWLKSS